MNENFPTRAWSSTLFFEKKFEPYPTRCRRSCARAEERTVRKHQKSLGLRRRECSTHCIALRKPGAPFEEKWCSTSLRPGLRRAIQRVEHFRRSKPSDFRCVRTGLPPSGRPRTANFATSAAPRGIWLGTLFEEKGAGLVSGGRVFF